MEEPEAGARLVDLFAALANKTRVAILHRLARPAFVPELADELDISRQAVTKHVEALVAAGLVRARRTRRGAIPAIEYASDPAGLFAFKEDVRALALAPEARTPHAAATRPGGARPEMPSPLGEGILLVHGDARGRWWPTVGLASVAIGRAEANEVPLPYDAFASARHAVLARDGAGWTVTDLHSRNGTQLNFETVRPGVAAPVVAGDVLGIGRSLLLLRGGA